MGRFCCCVYATDKTGALVMTNLNNCDSLRACVFLLVVLLFEQFELTFCIHRSGSFSGRCRSRGTRSRTLPRRSSTATPPGRPTGATSCPSSTLTTGSRSSPTTSSQVSCDKRVSLQTLMMINNTRICELEARVTSFVNFFLEPHCL